MFNKGGRGHSYTDWVTAEEVQAYLKTTYTDWVSAEEMQAYLKMRGKSRLKTKGERIGKQLNPKGKE